MLIPVIYTNGSHDLVKDFYLDVLIQKNRIASFKRSSGWVETSSPDVRGKCQRNFYAGPERRKELLQKSDRQKAPNPIEFYPADSFERFEHE